MADEVVHYRAKSMFTSKTFLTNLAIVVIAILALPEFISLIPSTWLPMIAAVTPILNILLRQVTNRPARWSVAPGTSKPVAVKKLTD